MVRPLEVGHYARPLNNLYAAANHYSAPIRPLAMSASAETILQHLRGVETLRAARAADPALRARVDAIKHYQHRRFERTYADLLASPRFGPAARFFLDDLYGPRDYSLRDAQFARVVPAMVRLFPQDIVHTVQQLGALHLLSEELDTAMARELQGTPATAQPYALAWQAVGRAPDRERQIQLMAEVGGALDRVTRNLLLRQTLKLMRQPARAAGLAALQSFLEQGFDTFRALRGADEFLGLISSRERALASSLFAADAVSLVTGQAPVLVQLP